MKKAINRWWREQHYNPDYKVRKCPEDVWDGFLGAVGHLFDYPDTDNSRSCELGRRSSADRTMLYVIIVDGKPVVVVKYENGRFFLASEEDVSKYLRSGFLDKWRKERDFPADRLKDFPENLKQLAAELRKENRIPSEGVPVPDDMKGMEAFLKKLLGIKDPARSPSDDPRLSA
jgi:hypothetical protein